MIADVSGYKDIYFDVPHSGEPLSIEYETAALIDVGAQVMDEAPYYALRIVADPDPGTYVVQKMQDHTNRMPTSLDEYRFHGAHIALGQRKPDAAIRNHDQGLLLAPTLLSDGVYVLGEAPTDLRDKYGIVAVEADQSTIETAWSLLIQPPKLAVGGLSQLIVRQHLP